MEGDHGANPSDNKAGDNYPVEQVSWNDCKEFVEALNSRYAPVGWHLALPTEAQWEYACRAGTTGAYGGIGRLDDMGWYSSNIGNSTHPVGQKTPNAWGLYDMHGNVWEWCADRYGGYPTGAVTDTTGSALGGNRVLRGVSFWYIPQDCRSAGRDGLGPDDRIGNFGLRLLAFQNGK